MIGTFGFLEELSFVLIPILLLLIVVTVIRRWSKKGGGFSTKGLLALVVVVLLPVVTTWRFANEVKNHLFFTSLTPEKIESFSVGSQRITDQRAKILVVRALREIQWFSPHHGGWARPIDLRIRLISGEERLFEVAVYLRESGAVIDFSSAYGHAGLHPGYAFSPNLPHALSELGVELPR